MTSLACEIEAKSFFTELKVELSSTKIGADQLWYEPRIVFSGME